MRLYTNSGKVAEPAVAPKSTGKTEAVPAEERRRNFRHHHDDSDSDDDDDDSESEHSAADAADNAADVDGTTTATYVLNPFSGIEDEDFRAALEVGST